MGFQYTVYYKQTQEKKSTLRCTPSLLFSHGEKTRHHVKRRCARCISSLGSVYNVIYKIIYQVYNILIKIWVKNEVQSNQWLNLRVFTGLNAFSRVKNVFYWAYFRLSTAVGNGLRKYALLWFLGMINILRHGHYLCTSLLSASNFWEQASQRQISEVLQLISCWWDML